MVEGVDEIRPELQVDSLGQIEEPRHRKIVLLQAGLAARLPLPELPNLSCGAGVKAAGLNQPSGPWIGQHSGAADVIRLAASGEHGGVANDVIGEARLQVDNPTDLPIAQRGTEQSGGFSNFGRDPRQSFP